jgi:catechol 2,3-dioxygenase-like lactoylglutathione lyase family enzyme
LPRRGKRFIVKPAESLRFFTEILGLDEADREEQSVYLRGRGEWLHSSIKLTEGLVWGSRTLAGVPKVR